ncbi:YdbC family protein [Veronia nyctiphanis]|uniref:YdbC family protein n=1 Tax=Veronia nyctiphanis TaxID=1278244 RepID=UPI00137591C4|nr:YdbC family protein [Veronia nyctiphanis]
MSIIKLIRCAVTEGQKESFSQGQSVWSELKGCDGFEGQCGGWSEDGEALVLGQWRSKKHVSAFMESVHDALALKSHQQRTYRYCDVHYFEKVKNIQPIVDNVIQPNRSFIHLTLYRQIQHVNRFTHDILNTENPEPKASDGMLGGFLARGISADDCFLVATFWRSYSHFKGDRRITPCRIRGAEQSGNVSEWRVNEEAAWKVSPL